MAAVIIKSKDVDRLGKELLNEMFNFLHDDYILKEFVRMKKEQIIFLEKLVFNHIKTLHRQFKITKEKRDELIKPFIDPLFDTYKRVECNPQLVKDAMKNDGVDTKGIYQILLNITINEEADEDLYFKTKSFLDIYRVFKTGYTYL